MIEAMACGTPVIAFEQGAVPEVVRHGVTGFIVGSERAACQAVHDLPQLSRSRVRREFEQCFTAQRMARDYVGVYATLREGRRRALAQAV